MKKSKIIDMIKWKCDVGFCDTTELPFKGYAPYSNLVDAATESVSLGYDAIKEKAKSCDGGPFVVISCSIRTTNKAIWEASSTVLPTKVEIAVRSCFNQCVERAMQADRVRVLNPPPGASEKTREFLGALGEIVGHIKKGKEVAKTVQTILPNGGKVAAAAGVAAAAASATAGSGESPTEGIKKALGGFDLGALISQGMNSPEIAGMVKGFLKNPATIGDALKEMGIDLSSSKSEEE